MTEQDIVNEFVENVLPFVRNEYEKDGITDAIARREHFNNYVSYFCENGLVSEELANEICLPDYLEE